MKKQTMHTSHVYRTFESTNRYAIEIAIDNYNDIFNEWDPAPFKRRSLNPELQYFIDECSNDISIRHPLAIVFYMPRSEHTPEKEAICIDGIRTHFAYMKHVLDKDEREVMVNVLRNTAIGILLLCLAFAIESQQYDFFAIKIVTEGFFIGGWVFIWEALATIGFKNSDMRYRQRELARLLDAPIVFKKEQLPEQSALTTT